MKKFKENYEENKLEERLPSYKQQMWSNKVQDGERPGVWHKTAVSRLQRSSWAPCFSLKCRIQTPVTRQKGILLGQGQWL